MTPQVNLNGVPRVAEEGSMPPVAPVTPPSVAPFAPPLPAPRREMTEAERQGMAMGWIAMAFGIFLLLGGLALWAAVALNAGFGGWLIGVAVMGLAMVAVAVAVAYYVVRPGR